MDNAKTGTHDPDGCTICVLRAAGEIKPHTSSLNWEQIIEFAKRTNLRPTRDGALLLAAHLLDFDCAVKCGSAKLPGSWAPAAVHLAGYDPCGEIK